MKYIVLLCDGMADWPLESLGGKTVTQAANIPNMDKLATGGICGLIHTVPDGMAPGSDVCNLSIFGYNPAKYYTGRSPLEAVSMGVELGEHDTALRCNIITLGQNMTVMDDFTAGHIDGIYSENVIESLKEVFKDEKNIEFYKGVGYRHLVVLRNIDINPETTPPHDITGKEISAHMPCGDGGDVLRHIMQKAQRVFDGRIDAGKGNAIWLWGAGKRPSLPSYKEMYGIKGAVISAVDLIKGIGICAGLEIIDVPGATGFIDTNFEGKAQYAVNALETNDYVFVHVEATDECGHMGDAEKKIKAAEAIDSRMLPILMRGLEKFGDYRILITPDHPTPIELKTHSKEPVPAIIFGTGINPDENTTYGEHIKPSFDIKDGYRIADYFIKDIKD